MIQTISILNSHGLLPLITQPTRLSDTSKTLIDNIYTNVFHKESISGNILIERADHLAQFAFFEDFLEEQVLCLMQAFSLQFCMFAFIFYIIYIVQFKYDIPVFCQLTPRSCRW